MNKELLIHNAEEKLNSQAAKAGLTGKEGAVLPFVKKALIEFCRQESEFAQAIIENSKTLSDCCKEIMKNCGNSISDFAVYQKAVQFYFPGADISFNMKIDLCASVNKPTSALTVSLTDLLGGGI